MPKYPCKILHFDIIEVQGQIFLSHVDKFLKFAKFFSIKNKLGVHLRYIIAELLHYFTVPKIILTGKEKGFLSFEIQVYQTPSQRSEVNGQIERLHSTIIETFRCLQMEVRNRKTKDMVYTAVNRYNNTIHSVTKVKP